MDSTTPTARPLEFDSPQTPDHPLCGAKKEGKRPELRLVNMLADMYKSDATDHVPIAMQGEADATDHALIAMQEEADMCRMNSDFSA